MINQIDHIIYIVREEHTFDSLFGRLPGVEGVQLNNAPLRPPPMRNSHNAWLQRLTTASYLQYSSTDLLDYTAYATKFTNCDQFFSEVGGPSLPNHFMLFTAQTPTLLSVSRSVYRMPSLPQLLTNAGISWRNYGGQVPLQLSSLRTLPFHSPANQFAIDATKGALPAVSWLFAPAEYSEAPPANILEGQAWTVAQINAIVDGGLWNRCAIFIVWDSWGGWADHVSPPMMEQWKDDSPYRYGSRVGCIVLSPFSRRGYVSHIMHSHTSLIKFCTTYFQISSLNERDSAASDMFDCFDFSQTPLPPPAPLPGFSLVF